MIKASSDIINVRKTERHQPYGSHPPGEEFSILAAPRQIFIRFFRLWYALQEGSSITGDLLIHRVYSIEPMSPVPDKYFVQAWRCDSCGRIFIATDMDGLGHECTEAI